ncbi:hypothetical protein Mal64_24480 [Pseudobythopirellula maris]|uniref:Uncharacterized protein n=1 Tax=Pseudobythopirellula maris TaxID=2527991 RepID=A0A5C5ZPW5_9BACT|nr:hypothetical protein [Pseudobythopirellula maris]TWT88957.1 hypothetical protein Mal64_24480 [Pseudobythopirellula maris]
MNDAVVRFERLDDLRVYVLQTLCSQDKLEANSFSLAERPLVRRGRDCGVQFSLHGPRKLLLMAIWDTVTNTILFYGSTGARFLVARVDPVPAAA